MAAAAEIPGGWEQADVPSRPRTNVLSNLDDTDPVRVYLNEIGKTPLLDKEGEIALAKRIDAGAFAGIILSLQDPETQDQTLDNLSTTIKRAGVGEGKAKDNSRKRTEEEIEAEIDRLVYYATEDEPEITCPDGRVTTPSARELRQLVQDGERAKQHLIKANLRLVVSVAKKYQHQFPLLDAIQEGNLGLMHAVDKFDYTKGWKFSTYSMWWIRQAITRAIADTGRTIRIPVHTMEKVNKVTRTRRELRAELGVEPTPEQIAKELDMTPERAAELLEYDAPIHSLNQQVGGREGDGSSAELGDYVHDQTFDAPDGSVMEGEMVSKAREALSWLPERERLVLEMRWGINGHEPSTLNEISYVLGTSRETVRNIEKIAKVRFARYASHLQAFLDD